MLYIINNAQNNAWIKVAEENCFTVLNHVGGAIIRTVLDGSCGPIKKDFEAADKVKRKLKR